MNKIYRIDRKAIVTPNDKMGQATTACLVLIAHIIRRVLQNSKFLLCSSMFGTVTAHDSASGRTRQGSAPGSTSSATVSCTVDAPF